MKSVYTIIVVIIAYFLGNISPSTILGKKQGIDIKKEGSGNAGTTNALRVLGKKAAVITLFIDVFKGVIAVELGTFIAGTHAGYICALAAFIGHIWPVIYKFKGGKGVAVAFGALLGVNWMVALSCLGVVIITVLLTRMVSMGSIMAAVSFPVFAYFWEPEFLWIGISMALVVLYVHRANIVRIIKGEENKISFKK